MVTDPHAAEPSPKGEPVGATSAPAGERISTGIRPWVGPGGAWVRYHPLRGLNRKLFKFVFNIWHREANFSFLKCFLFLLFVSFVATKQRFF